MIRASGAAVCKIWQKYATSRRIFATRLQTASDARLKYHQQVNEIRLVGCQARTWRSNRWRFYICKLWQNYDTSVMTLCKSSYTLDHVEKKCQLTKDKSSIGILKLSDNQPEVPLTCIFTFVIYCKNMTPASSRHATWVAWRSASGLKSGDLGCRSFLTQAFQQCYVPIYKLL